MLVVPQISTTMVVSEVELPFLSRVIGAAPSLAEACALIPGKILALEKDPLHPGHWDVMTMTMRQFTIEPKP